MSVEYPKIETLYDRNDKFKVIEGKLRLDEFSLVERWLVTEKIDGTNVRIEFMSAGPETNVVYKGRTDNAQMPPALLDALLADVGWEVIPQAFDVGVSGVLYGEGYGPKIQSGGYYRPDSPGFRLFDVRVGDWWLNWPDIEDIANKLGVQTVPVLARDVSLETAANLAVYPSATAALDGGDSARQHEGIVCRTDPLLLTRSSSRLMWKLKGKDFA